MAAESDHGSGPFPGTSWSLVARATVSNDLHARSAMDVLLRRYAPALRARLLRDHRMDAEHAADVLQGFISDKVLEQELLRKADRGVGKFRTFLLTAFDNYVVDQHRYRSAKCRAPGGRVEPLEDIHPATTAPATDGFDRAWAQQVVADAVARMRAECAAERREDVWGVFQARVLEPAVSGAAPLAYDQLVARFGLRSPDHASNVLMTAKRMFARALRGVVGEHVERDEEVDAEIADLRKVLAAAGAGNGRLPRT